MDALVFLALAIVVCGPVALALAIASATRTSALRRRLDRLEDLETQVAALRARLERVPGEPRTAPERPAPERGPEPRPASEPRPRAPVPSPEPAPEARVPAPPPPPRAERRPPVEAPPPPPPPAGPRIDWERWIGIRGAAVLGAVVLALAGLLFFQYSIERGLITPTMRVALGTAVGLGCLGGSDWLRRRRYGWASSGIAGAGVVILYAAFWAAHVLYALIGAAPAFVLMILVTSTCCLVAYRSGSLLVAVLGLVGGFATPLLLSTGTDRPIGLFGYVLLLDLGLLALGHGRRWPALGVLSLLGTVLLQGLWIGARMGPERVLLGLVILAVFAVLFALSGRLAPGGTPERARSIVQGGAILFPFAFALYFAGRVELGPHLFPIALLLALLGTAACWLGRAQGTQPLALGSAAATIAVVGVWLLRHPLTSPLAWEVSAVAVGLAAVYHAWVERDREPHGIEGPAPAAVLATGGLLALTVLASGAAGAVPPWPWLAAWIALAGLLYRHAELPRRGALRLVAVAGLGCGLSLQHAIHGMRAVFPDPALYLALLIAFCVALHAVALWRRRADPAGLADYAAAALPALLLLSMVFSRFAHRLPPIPGLGTALLLGVLALVAATRRRDGAWCAVATGTTLLAHWAWTLDQRTAAGWPAGALAALVTMGLSVVVFTAWPFLARKTFATQRAAWYAAALSGPIWFLPTKGAFEAAFGDSFIGVLPVALAALAVTALSRARAMWPADAPLRRAVLAWFAAVAFGFAAVAIPLQLEKEWITIGWALEGLGLVALWRRLDHPGLKYFGLALLGAATVRLVLNPAIPGYYARSSVRVFNWLMYTYLVPAAALVGSAALLRPTEVERLVARERRLYRVQRPLGASLAGVAAILVVFVWINLTIADWFATGTRLVPSLGATPAQRLAVSLAWAVYALLLLGLGVNRDSQGLRWISLGCLLVTIGKVFLYDLGNLSDLYRVASLGGLAVSLILVSLLYQRLVFRKERRTT